MTLHDFLIKHKVEVTMDENGIYNCYIDYKEGDKPWGQSTIHCLDAIERGIDNYSIQSTAASQLPQAQTLQQIQEETSEKLRKFLSTDALFIWYFYARKYNIPHVVNHYEALAQQTHPNYLAAIQFIYDSVQKVIDDPTLEIKKDYAAINNIFIQALVYYESLKMQKYENNAIIRDLLAKMSVEDREAFKKVQKTVEDIDFEIQNNFL